MHYTLWLTLLHHFVQRLSQQAATASFEGDKLSNRAKSNETSASVLDAATQFQQLQTSKISAPRDQNLLNVATQKFAKMVPERHTGGGRSCRTDDAPVYRTGCCGPWPGHEMAEDEEDPKLVAKLSMEVRYISSFLLLRKSYKNMNTS